METLLARLGVASPANDLEGLSALMRAWLKASPFHNLDLLAYGLTGPISEAAAVRQAWSLRGGPCHVQAAGFLALLKAVGFDAHLVAGTIKVPDDHLLIRVHLPEGAWWVDVGNGQPFTGPFPADRPTEQHRFGWRFRTTPLEGGGLRLEREFGAQDWRVVYTADPAPRVYGDFAHTIAAHHGQAGFGPFLTGLRAVRVGEFGMVTLRDGVYARHTELGCFTRPVVSGLAAGRLLRHTFGLTEAPIEAALAKVPHVFPSATAFTDLVISLATTARPKAFAHLVEGLLAQEQPAGLRVHLLVVENSPDAADRRTNAATLARAEAAGLRLLLVDDGRYGTHLAESRLRQVDALATAIQAGRIDRSAMVWMLDDDLAFEAVLRSGRRLERRPVTTRLAEALELWREHPEASVILGYYTGSPPIRPAAMLACQAHDFEANLGWFATQAPDAPYQEPSSAPLLGQGDYYYDHAEGPADHLDQVFGWPSEPGAGPSVRDQLAAYVRALSAVPDGEAATRPLAATQPILERCHRPTRGGNALFLDLDACLRHPYPVVRLPDGPTRRADMVGASLLARDPLTSFWRGPLDLLHRRSTEDRPGGGSALGPLEQSPMRDLRAEFFGVLLARRVMEGAHPTTHQRARDRHICIADRTERLYATLARIERRLALDSAWWQEMGAEIAHAISRLRATAGGHGPPGEVKAYLADHLLDHTAIAAVEAAALAADDLMAAHVRHIARRLGSPQ